MGRATPIVMVTFDGNTKVSAMKRFILFFLVGGANTLIGIAMMIAFFYITGNAYLANVTAYTIGFFLSFWLQDIITFGDVKNKPRTRIIAYSATYLIAFLVNFVFLSICLQIPSLPKEVIFILSSGVFAMTSYSLMNNFVFISQCERSRNADPAAPPC